MPIVNGSPGYDFRVIAYNSRGESTASSEVSGVIPVAPSGGTGLAAPTNLEVRAFSYGTNGILNSNLAMRWNNPSTMTGISGYTIQVQLVGAGDSWTTVAGNQTHSGGLTAGAQGTFETSIESQVATGQTFNLRMRARNSANDNFSTYVQLNNLDNGVD